MRKETLLVSLVVLLTAGLAFVACTQPPPAPPAATAGPGAAPAQPPAAPQGQVIRWRGQTLGPSTIAPYGPFGQGRTGVQSTDREWSQWLQKATNGRLVIEWAEPDAIFPSFEALNAVGKRVVDIATSFGTYYSGTLPEAYVESGLPFAWSTVAEEHDAFYNYGLDELIKEAYAEKNIYFQLKPVGALVGIGTTFPAPNPASIQGKKIRATGVWGDYVAMLGGSPVPATWGEMYMGLKLGTFDGWMAGSATLEELKLKEVTKGFILNPMVSGAPSNILINMDAYKALPKDIQTIIDRDLRLVTYAASHRWQLQCMYVLTDAQKKYGLQMYDWSQDSPRLTKQAVDTIWSKVAGLSPRTAKLVDLVKKQLRDYGRLD